jgi:hypothetical protein
MINSTNLGELDRRLFDPKVSKTLPPSTTFDLVSPAGVATRLSRQLAQ